MQYTLRIAISLVLLLLANVSFAQKELASGVVKDSAGNPIPLAVILTVNPQDSSVVFHTVTNTAGVFRIKGEHEGKFWIQAHQLGFLTESKEITLPHKDAITFTLKDDPKEIEAVRIGARRGGMTRKGDTVGYNLKAYATGMEKTLGDVLANLPGMKVAPDGNVTVEGKTVSKILFNGRDYFGDNIAMATKNIEADVADTVRVIKGYSEFSIIDGFQNKDETVIDVGVKDNKLNKIRGTIEAGGGYRNAYSFRAQPHYMGTNHMFSALVASNNMADPTFTIMDYLAMQGGLQNPEGGYRISVNLGHEIGNILNPPSDTYKMTAHAVNLLYNYHKQDQLKVTAAVMGAIANNDTKTEVLHTFVVGSQKGTSYRTGNTSRNDVQYMLGNFALTYTPTKQWMFLLGANTDFGKSDIHNNHKDNYQNKLITTTNNQQTRPFNWTARGGVYFRPSEHLFYISGSVNSKLARPIDRLKASDLILPLRLLPNADGRYLLQFLERQKELTANEEIGARLMLTKHQKLKFWVSHNSVQYSRYANFESDSPISLLPSFNGSLETNLHFLQQLIKLGTSYVFDNDYIYATLSLAGAYLRQDTRQPQQNRLEDGFYWEPELRASYHILPGMNLGAHLSSQIKVQSPKTLGYGMIMNSYRSITQNHDFSRLYDHSYSAQVNFSYYPTEESYSMYAVCDYDRTEKPFNRLEQFGLLNISSPFGISNSEWLSAGARVSNRFGGIWTLSLKYDWSRSLRNILYGTQINKVLNYEHEISFEAQSTYSSMFNVQMELEGSRNQYLIAQDPAVVDYDASARGKLLFEWKDFRTELGGSYSVSAYSDKRPYLVGLDAELAYSLGYGLSVVLAGHNLLNLHLREWTDIWYSDLLRSERIYRSIPGYAIAKIRWEIGKKHSNTNDPEVKIIRRRY